ncbi:MAG: 16S rRNA (cytidine(1402)-2'-O)-methyltransferase, partial [Gaiellales bacterium]
LYVCAVPIGNLEDASPRLRRVLGEVDAIACEDTRSTRKLLDLLKITPVPRLLAHHDHNERASAAGVVALLEQGLNVALVSDAGTPAINDPGAELVAATHAAGLLVNVVPGPSAVSAALSVAGGREHAAGSGYRYCGFLPRGERELVELLQRHAHELCVAFESPRRLAASLGVLAAQQPERIVTVCRELTKLHEQVLRGTAENVAAAFADEVRGEVVLVLGPIEQVTPPADATDARAVELMLAMVEAGVGMKRSSKLVAEHLGGSSRALYEAGIAANSVDD